MINPNILALPSVAIAIAEPLRAFSATWRADNLPKTLRGLISDSNKNQAWPQRKMEVTARLSPLGPHERSMRCAVPGFGEGAVTAKLKATAQTGRE